MARKCEVSFKYVHNKDDMECSLYHIPTYSWITDINFDKIYNIATKFQKLKLDKLKRNREIEIFLNLNISDL